MAAVKNNVEIPLNTRVEMIRRFFTDSKPANHPITDHPVSKQEEYVRDLYLEMLCVMAQYENQNPENAFVLIKRILAACDKAQPLNEYIKRSMEITTERTAEFIRQSKSNQLREIFMIDSMLLSCSQGTPNEKQVEFLTQFGDMLGFDRESISEMAQFALAILEQDSNMYQSLLNDNNIKIQQNLLSYAKEFVIGAIIKTAKKCYYYAKKLSRFEVDLKKEYYKYCLEVSNESGEKLSVDQVMEQHIEWYGSEEAAIRATVGNGIHFTGFDELILENMVLDCENAYLSTIKNVIIKSCHVLSCTVHLESINKVLIDECVFKWVGANRYVYEADKSNSYYYNRAIQANLSGAVVYVKNTSFSNFKVYSCNNAFDKGCGTGAVFCDASYNSRSKAELTFENCDFTDNYVSCGYYRDYGNFSIFYSSSGDYKVNISNCSFSNCDNDGTSSDYCLFSGYNITENNNQLVNSKPIKRR